MPRKTKTTTATKKKAEAAATSDGIPDAVAAVVASLKKLGSAKVREEMGTRYGIHLPDPRKAFGVKMAAMQKVAKGAKRKDAEWNHALAAALRGHGHAGHGGGTGSALAVGFGDDFVAHDGSCGELAMKTRY